MYLDYLNVHTKYLCKYIWKIKEPLKIRIFMWFLHRRKITSLKGIGRVIQNVLFVTTIKLYNIYSFNALSQRLFATWRLVPPGMLETYMGTGYMGCMR
jgi:hypothetical protein